MADETSVQVNENVGEVQGQPQAAAQQPDDGTHFVHEVAVVTDRHILDPNDPLAVQVPEGVGASTAGHTSPLGDALKRGTVEDQFAAAGDQDTSSDDEALQETSASDSPAADPTT